MEKSNSLSNLFKSPFFHATFYLTAAGFLCRLLGFFYRIFLSNVIGAEGMGIYELIFPIYGLCHAISVSPIQTAISKFTAEESKGNGCINSRRTLHAGLFLSFSLSALLALSVWISSDWIANHFLFEERCTSLLKIMAVALPFSSIHSCISGYYYGIKKAGIPSLSQLTEQIVRVSSVYLLVSIAQTNHLQITPLFAVYGLLFGEAASFLFSTLSICLSKNCGSKKATAFWPIQLKNILLLAIPLSLNRLMLTFFQSIESISIPTNLRLYGMSSTTALETYGVFTGMSMHFILFPAAITNSLAVMLLPAVSEAQSQKNNRRISDMASKSLRFCLTIGILFTGIFLVYGADMGTIVFHNSLAGNYIPTLSWLCPFLYVSTTIGSILNGLGKTKSTFLHNMASLCLRILFIFLLVPRLGMYGYLLGVLISQLLLMLLHLYSCQKSIKLEFYVFPDMIKPIFCTASALLITKFLSEHILHTYFSLSPLLELGVHCMLSAFLFFIILYLTEPDGKSFLLRK